MKVFFDFYNWLQKTFRPPSAFSWHTLILLSIFSYYMSVLATGWLATLINNFGWIFLILGVHWATTSANQLRIGYKENIKDGFPLSPWITGALVSLYIFGGSTGEISWRNAIVFWPVFSAIIASLPDFLEEGEDRWAKLKRAPLAKRQNIVVLFGTQLLLSCWFQFHFVLQDWLVQYPSLLADDFRKSAFVVKWESELPAEPPRGAAILESIEPKLRAQLNGQPWPQIERSLLPEERKKLIDGMAKQAKQQISPIEEDRLWRVASNVSSRGSGYNLDLQAIWQGPRSKTQRSIVMPCQITPINRRTGVASKPLNTRQTSSSVTIGSVQCQPIKGWGVDAPMVANDSFIR